MEEGRVRERLWKGGERGRDERVERGVEGRLLAAVLLFSMYP